MHTQSTHRYQRLNRRDGVWDRLSISTLTIFNHRRQTYSFWILGCLRHGMHTACMLYIWHKASFIYQQAKRTLEVRPVVLCRENSTQLVIYLLDTCEYNKVGLATIASHKRLSVWSIDIAKNILVLLLFSRSCSYFECSNISQHHEERVSCQYHQGTETGILLLCIPLKIYYLIYCW